MEQDTHRVIYYTKFGKYEAWLTGKSILGLSEEIEYRQYFMNFRVLVYFKNIERNETKFIKVPVIDIFPIKRKGEKKYKVHRRNKEKGFERWLFNLLKSKNIDIIEYPQLRLHNPHNIELRKYYLQSAIGDKNIIVGKKPVAHKIESVEDRKWLLENGFYDSIIEWINRSDG